MTFNTKWRLLSLLILVLYAALAALSVWLLVRNIGTFIALGLTGIFFIYAAWLIFIGPESDRRLAKWFTVIASIGLIIGFLYFLSDQTNRRSLLIILVLASSYLALFNRLRIRYWTEVRLRAEQAGKVAHFKKPFLIINPKAGDGRSIKNHIDELAEQQGINVLMTQKGKDIADSAMEAVRAGADVLGISGGDGSIGAVAKVALAHNLPMVVLPGGTRCHFARDLGLEPKRIVDSLTGFRGVEHRIDVGDINGRIFLNNASFGIYADIVDNDDYRENKLQVSRKVLQDVVTGKKKPYDLQFKHKELSIKTAIQVLVGVNQYNTFNLFEMGHRQRLDEGVLQVNVITELNTQLIKQLLTTINIKKLTRRDSEVGLYQWTDKSFIVKSNKKTLVVGVDGEREEYKTPVQVKVRPKALRIYLPAEGLKRRRKNPLVPSTVNKMLGRIWH
jgi:diacylglycerol kinase family enzyme